jgi:hypothetical protein
VRLLKELHDLAAWRGQDRIFAERIAEIRQRNAKRSGLMKRLDQAGLGTAIAAGAESGSPAASPTRGRR